MLQDRALDFGGNWDSYLPLVEFSYNNKYHATIPTVPYEAQYRRKCGSSVHWDDVKVGKR